MANRLLATCIFSVVSLPSAFAQRVVQPFPKEVRIAKTVALINNTHNDAVEQGALEAIKRWGRLTVVNDTDSADLILTFTKKNEHEGSSTQKTNPDGKTDSGYSMTFGSSIIMKATLKGGDKSFYTTTTGESKKKAGNACVTDLQAALNSTP